MAADHPCRLTSQKAILLASLEDPSTKRRGVNVKCIISEADMKSFQSHWKSEGMDISLKNLCALRDHLAPDGYLMAQLPDGEIVGFLTATKITDDIGAVGCVLTVSHHRRQGIMRRMMTEAFEVLGARNVVLDAVSDALGVYGKMLFANATFTCVNYGGQLREHIVPVESVAKPYSMISARSVARRVEDVLKYDRTVHPSTANRDGYLKDLFARSDAHMIAAISREDEVVAGYVVTHSMNESTVFLGPLYADTENVARQLLNAVLPLIPSDCFTFIMCLQEDAMWRQLAPDIGLELLEGTCVRMHTDANVELPLHKIRAFSFPGCGGLSLC